MESRDAPHGLSFVVQIYLYYWTSSHPFSVTGGKAKGKKQLEREEMKDQTAAALIILTGDVRLLKWEKKWACCFLAPSIQPITWKWILKSCWILMFWFGLNVNTKHLGLLCVSITSVCHKRNTSSLKWKWEMVLGICHLVNQLGTLLLIISNNKWQELERKIYFWLSEAVGLQMNVSFPEEL